MIKKDIIFSTWLGLNMFFECHKTYNQSIAKVKIAESNNQRTIIKDANTYMVLVFALGGIALCIKADNYFIPSTVAVFVGTILLAFSYKNYFKYKESYENIDSEALKGQEKTLYSLLNASRICSIYIILNALFYIIRLIINH